MRLKRREGREEAVAVIAAMLDPDGPYEHGSGDERAALLAAIRLIREVK